MSSWVWDACDNAYWILTNTARYNKQVNTQAGVLEHDGVMMDIHREEMVDGLWGHTLSLCF